MSACSGLVSRRWAPMAAVVIGRETHAPVSWAIDIRDPGWGIIEKRTAGRCSRAASNFPPSSAGRSRACAPGGGELLAQRQHAGHSSSMPARFALSPAVVDAVDADLTRSEIRAGGASRSVAASGPSPGMIWAGKPLAAKERSRPPPPLRRWG